MADNDTSVINFELIKPALAQLTDLLAITGTYVDQYYNVFLNPTPMNNIIIKAYGANGKIQEIQIPNLAYLRQACMVGVGKPEGVVEAPLGTFYLNMSTGFDAEIYVKQGSENVDSTGWLQLSTFVAMQEALNSVNQIAQDLEDSVQQVSDSVINLQSNIPLYCFPVFSNSTAIALNSDVTTTEYGWLELSNTTSQISVSIDGATHNVGNYAFIPLLTGTVVNVATADTTAIFYKIVQSE